MVWFVFWLIVLIACLMCMRNETPEPELSMPDPTDDEFVRRLPENIPPELALRVRRIVADASGWGVEEVWPETTMLEITEF